MLEPYHLTIRFRAQGDTATLDLETDDGASDVATFTPPFGDDHALVLRALDAAQFPAPTRPSWSFTPSEQERLVARGFWQGGRVVPEIHARVGRALLAALTADSAAAAIIAQARAAAQASGQPLELVLRSDLCRGDLIQGRLHQLLMRILAEQTETLLAAYSQGTERLSAEVQAVLAEVQALRDDLRQRSPFMHQPVPAAPPTKLQTGGIDFGTARIGSMGDVVAGDKIGSDKVMGDKVINYGAPRPADTKPAHLQRLIELHTRRLRVLEEQATRAGHNARPEVLIEIDDIRAEIARLRELLNP